MYGYSKFSFNKHIEQTVSTVNSFIFRNYREFHNIDTIKIVFSS